jgi:heme A synthase
MEESDPRSPAAGGVEKLHRGTGQPVTSPVRERNALFSALVGLASLAILLQGVWAGMFIRPGQPDDGFWVTVHARGAEVAIALALAAAVVAFVRLRSRRDLVVGSGALVVLLALEAYIGGELFDHQGLAAVHFPLALALMALAVWLPFQSRRQGRRHAE